MEAYINRGNAHDDKGNHNAAIADYTEAIRLDAKNARIYYDRGIALRRDGRPADSCPAEDPPPPLSKQNKAKFS